MLNALAARKIQLFFASPVMYFHCTSRNQKTQLLLSQFTEFVKVTREQGKDVIFLALHMSAVGSSASLVQVVGQCQQSLYCLSSTESLQKILRLMPLEASQKFVWIPEGCTGFGRGANRSSATIPVQSQAEERQRVPEGGH